MSSSHHIYTFLTMSTKNERYEAREGRLHGRADVVIAFDYTGVIKCPLSGDLLSNTLSPEELQLLLLLLWLLWLLWLQLLWLLSEGSVSYFLSLLAEFSEVKFMATDLSQSQNVPKVQMALNVLRHVAMVT